jgi:7-cyano-7-deazaguanine synthase in queuosine biosynthesis
MIIDGVDIPFDNSWKNIAVSLSGGADSALLAYLLCLEVQSTNVHIISHVRNWKTKPWQEWDSLKVYHWLQNKFPKINFQRHLNFIPPEFEWADKGPTITDEYGKLVSGDNVELRAFAEYICFKSNIDAYYNAVTRNPKDVDFQGMPTRDIDPTDENQHLVMMKHMNRWAIHPFRFVDKSWIVSQYKRLGLEDLFDITRSCEGAINGFTHQNYIPRQYVPTCGECFWCKERAWAIEQSK